MPHVLQASAATGGLSAAVVSTVLSALQSPITPVTCQDLAAFDYCSGASLAFYSTWIGAGGFYLDRCSRVLCWLGITLGGSFDRGCGPGITAWQSRRGVHESAGGPADRDSEPSH